MELKVRRPEYGIFDSDGCYRIQKIKAEKIEREAEYLLG
jgi:hypothetical protein